jgi:hypothetical protein
MKSRVFSIGLSLVASLIFARNASAQLSTPPASKDELEAVYTTAIEGRTIAILKPLNLTDSVKSNEVHDILIAQYRALRARDEVIDAKLQAQGQDVNYSNRIDQLASATKPLHEQFITKLNQDLTPAQVDQVKDLMTYNKVKFTYDGYCSIVPDLTDADKARIMDLLKDAREEAMDGGSAREKSTIFQKYKDQINVYLDAHGHNVAKAMSDWQAAHTSASATTTTAH